MKNLLIILFAFLTVNVFGQEMVQNIQIRIFVKDLAQSKAPIEDFIKKNPQITVMSYTEGTDYYPQKQLSFTLICDEKNAQLIDNQLNSWGYIDNRQVQTINHTFEIEKQNMELDFLKKRLDTYQKELKESEKQGEQYRAYFNEVRGLENQIFSLEKRIKELQQQVKNYTYQINIQEENTTPQGNNTRVSFVNMPGIQYSLINIENPTQGFSSNAYQGLSLKYMFTKGKSFVEIGVFRSVKPIVETDSSTISELFAYSFGQDFYPTHFGRGTRRFLNLYTGYSIGGVFATSRKNSHHFIQISPHFGIEIFKSRSILLDTNVGYYIPLYENRNLRGLLVNASFNFLF